MKIGFSFIMLIRMGIIVCVTLQIKLFIWIILNLDPALDTWDFSSPLISLWINRFYIYLGFAFGFSLWICFQIVIRKQVSGAAAVVVFSTGEYLASDFIGTSECRFSKASRKIWKF